MTPTSAIIFSVFGAVWAVGAIFSQPVPHPWLCAFPAAIAILLVMRARVRARHWPTVSKDEERRRNKIVMYATAFEGGAIFVGVNVLRNLGITGQYLTLIALIVGLHFLPFARFLPERRYYLIALLLIVIGIAGVWIPPPDLRAWFVGLGSAAVLWLAALLVLRTPSASP